MRASSTFRALGTPLILSGLLCLVCTTVSEAHAAPPTKLTLSQNDGNVAVPSLRKGLVVVAIGEGAPATDAAWPVALAIYADAALRPKLVDRDARVLAGGAPPAGAPKDTVELSDLRSKVHGDDVASRALLAEIARRTGARALVLVTPAIAPTATAPGAAAQSQIYDAADDRIEPTLFRPDASSKSGPWSSLVAGMHARFAPDAPNTSNIGPGPTGETPKPTNDSISGGSFISSPWFWGALGAAVLGGVLVYATTRDSGQGIPPPVRVEWGK